MKKELTENEIILSKLAIANFLIQGIFTVVGVREDANTRELRSYF